MWQAMVVESFQNPHICLVDWSISTPLENMQRLDSDRNQWARALAILASDSEESKIMRPLGSLRYDGKGPRSLVDQGQETNQIDPASIDLQVVVEQEILYACGTGHHPDEDGLG